MNHFLGVFVCFYFLLHTTNTKKGGNGKLLRRRGKKANIAITIVAQRMCQIVYRLLKERRPYRDHRAIAHQYAGE